MEYRIIYGDELYHYGVRGMRWGHRKAPTSIAGTGHRALSGVYGINQRFYNRTGNKALASMNAQARNSQLKKASIADKRANTPEAKSARKARAKNAAKIGAAVAVTALAAYGGYKAYKLHNSAVTSLGKKYSSLSKQYMDLVDLNRKTARSQANQADKYKLLAGYVQKNEPGNKWEADVYRKAARDLMKTSNESDARAEKRLEDAMKYYSKAKSKDFSKKEVAREMMDIAKRRKRNNR